MKNFIRLKLYQYLNENISIPNILYHASNNLFDKFELKQGYRTHLFSVEKINSHAIFLTADIDAAKQFGEKYLYTVKINPKRILDWTEHLDVRTYEWIKKNFPKIIPWNVSEYWMLLDDKRIIDYLKLRGVDSVVITEIGQHDQFITYAVLNPNTIQILNVTKI